MMKLNSKFLRTMASATLVASFFLPSFVFAREINENPRGADSVSDTRKAQEKRSLFERKSSETKKVTPSDGTNFCTRFESNTQKLTQEFDRLNLDLKGTRDDQNKKLQEFRNKIDSRFDSSRDKWEANRIENFDKLMARATTDAQKAAVSQFKTTIQNALTTRYTAVDAARKVYQSGVDALLASRKTSLESARTTMKNSVDAAIAKAKAECATTTPDGALIKKTFQDALKTAREIFKTSAQTLETPNTALETLKKTRDEAIKKAHDDFKTTQDAAITTLKAVFSQVAN